MTPKERKHLIKLCSKITFVSNWVKDFSKESKLKKNTTIFGFTSNVSKTFDNFKYVNLKFSNFGVQSKNLKYVNKFIDVLEKKNFLLSKYIIALLIFFISKRIYLTKSIY